MLKYGSDTPDLRNPLIINDITDIFLNNGEIVSTRGRRAKENRKFFAKKGDKTNGKNCLNNRPEN